ncbi:MAG TPA: galactose-1-phosphate uridylyltransferase [Pirellulales bacterium]|jgi:UDPglucose--hexose-1-phosphate uridylyltransferase|nr:galactose-1-phosphate uridylyltransferase [Pirellulales bacterium]
MSELRKDPIVDHWVIIAENRAERPNELLQPEPAGVEPEACPFCAGNEEQTPGEVAALRPAASERDAPGWRVRVVPNRYPALEHSADQPAASNGFYSSVPGVGVHEVIIECPEHLVRTTDLSEEQLAEVLLTYRDRLLVAKLDRRLRSGMIFKNVGAAAGASIEHTHSQLIATPLVPTSLAEELSSASEFYRAQGRCIFCELVERERADARRVVLDASAFVAFCPYAARFPYETWILPGAHSSHYETLSRYDCHKLASILLGAMTKIDAAADRPAYNLVVHSAPFDAEAHDLYHWHIEIIPRLTSTAGFEWGSGLYINPLAPERAAERLRDC